MMRERSGYRDRAALDASHGEGDTLPMRNILARYIRRRRSASCI